jgi:hypothetical protein
MTSLALHGGEEARKVNYFRVNIIREEYRLDIEM